VKIPRADVTVRQHFVDRDRIQRVLDLASPTWQTIIALSRFGGLRCPSEVLSLEWRHIDWLKGEILVQSPKTERYAGMETRKIPLFADLRPYLEDAHHLVEPGQTHVVGGNHLAKAQGQNGWKNCNLRTTFEKLIKRAGVEPWPKLFHNLRSSFETELLRSHPVHVVAAWLGHDVDVCIKHYAQITDADYRRANNSAENSALPQAQTARNRAQHIPAGNSKEVKNVPQSEGREAFTAEGCDSMRDTAQLFSGEEGIRTLGTVLPIRGFSKAVLSTTQPPLRRGEC
jgi:integrase